MKVRVRWFAVLRDARGLPVEEVEGAFTTPAALWDELARRHVLPLPLAGVRVSVNAAYVEPTVTLRDGDEVAFIPPVSGG